MQPVLVEYGLFGEVSAFGDGDGTVVGGEAVEGELGEDERSDAGMQAF